MKNYFHLIISCIMLLVFMSCLNEEIAELDNPYEDLTGSTILLNPLEVHTQVNEHFSIHLRLEHVSSFMGVFAEIEYDTEYLIFDYYELIETDSSMLGAFAGDYFSFIENDSDNGLITVSLSVASGTMEGLLGAGDLVQLNFKATQRGETDLILANECRLTDNNMDEIPIDNLYNGVVYVE